MSESLVAIRKQMHRQKWKEAVKDEIALLKVNLTLSVNLDSSSGQPEGSEILEDLVIIFVGFGRFGTASEYFDEYPHPMLSHRHYREVTI